MAQDADDARIAEQTATDCLMRAMEHLGEENLTRVTVLAMTEDGSQSMIFSNARSEAEMRGMLLDAQDQWTNTVYLSGDEAEDEE